MPGIDLRWEAYDQAGRSHRWIVSSNSIVSRYDEPFPIPEIKRWDVYFISAANRNWECTCTKLSPGAKLQICEHILFVAGLITSKKGNWERDGSLMVSAWKLVRTGRSEMTVERMASRYNGSIQDFWVYSEGTRSPVRHDNIRQYYLCDKCGRDYSSDYRDPCAHVQAVKEFEKVELKSQGPSQVIEARPYDPRLEVEVRADVTKFSQATDDLRKRSPRNGNFSLKNKPGRLGQKHPALIPATAETLLFICLTS